MSGWSLVAAAVLSGLAINSSQEPSVTVRAEPIRTVTVAGGPANIQERVSASFNQASVREVLDWLSKNGVSFVAADGDFAKDATVTLNVRNQPASDIADAIAQALGGHWQRRGEIMVFRKGGHDFMFSGPGAMTMPRVQGFPLSEGGQMFRFEGPDGKKTMGIEMQRSMEKLHEALPKMNWQGPEGEKMRIELKRSMDQLHKELPKIRIESMKALKDHKLSEGEQKRIHIEIEKAMGEAHKGMEKAHKEMERARKEHPEAFDGEHRVFMAPHGGDGKDLFELHVEKGGLTKVGPLGHGKIRGESMMLRPATDGGIEKLVMALSPAQRELHRRQGYLKASDLTPNQLKMLGMKTGKGNWTIKFVKDNDEIVIKNGE